MIKKVCKDRQICRNIPVVKKHPKGTLHDGDLIPAKIEIHKGSLLYGGKTIDLLEIRINRIGEDLLYLTPVQGTFIQSGEEFLIGGLLFQISQRACDCRHGSQCLIILPGQKTAFDGTDLCSRSTVR